MALLKPRTYRLREDQYHWLKVEANRKEGGEVVRVLRRLIDAAMKKVARS